MVRSAPWFPLLMAFHFLAASVFAHADGFDASNRADFLLFGDYRYLNQAGIYNVDFFTDGFFIFGDQVRLRYEAMQLEVRPEVRGLTSQSLTLQPGDPARLTVQAPRRLVNLDYKFASAERGEWYVDVEKLKFSLFEENFEIYAGRLPVSLGVLKYIPVWNKFTKPFPTTTGAPLVFSQDAAGARIQLGKVAIQALDLEGPTQDDAVRIGEVTWYSPWAELHFLGSYWWKQITLGGAFSADAGPVNLKGEVLAVGIAEGDADRQLQAGAGFEWSPAARWVLTAEGLYQSKGVTSSAAYSPVLPSRFMELQGAAYALTSIQFQATDFWKLSVMSLVSLVDGSPLVLPSFTYSIANNLDLSVSGLLPAGPSKSEFSRDTYTVGSGRGQGFPYQAAGSLKFFF